MADCGNQIPVDDVAEGLVDPCAVLEHRHALRCSQQRRGGEAAEIDVRLERIALSGIRRDAAGILLEKIGHIRLPLMPDVLARVHLHIRRDILDGRPQPGKRRSADDLNRWQLERLGWIELAAPRSPWIGEFTLGMGPVP